MKRMLSRAVLVRQMIKMETKFSILLTTALIIVMLFNWMAIVMVQVMYVIVLRVVEAANTLPVRDSVNQIVSKVYIRWGIQCSAFIFKFHITIRNLNKTQIQQFVP
jgi:hypothetical protein